MLEGRFFWLAFMSVLTFAVVEIPLILGLDEVFVIPFVLDLTPDSISDTSKDNTVL